MTTNTQHLRDLISQACPLPWLIATSNSYRRIVRADRYEEVCSPVTMPDGHPDLWFPDGFDGPNARLLIEAANALPQLLDRVARAEATLDVITRSTAAALARHGVTEADDPGEAIDVLVVGKDRDIARLRMVLMRLIEISEPNIYPQLNKPNSAWAVLQTARAALQESSRVPTV